MELLVDSYGRYGKGHTSDDVSAVTLSLSKLFTASVVKTGFPALGCEGKVWLEKGCSYTKASSLGRVLLLCSCDILDGYMGLYFPFYDKLFCGV